MRGKYCILLLVAVLVVSPSIVAAQGEKSYTGVYGVEYSVRFDESTEVLTISINNPRTREIPILFEVRMDSTYSKPVNVSLEPGEQKQYQFDLTRGVDLTKDRHSVAVDLYEKTLWFNYTREIIPADTSRYNTPKITDVDLETKKFRGENRTVINVTGYNPTARKLLLVVRAHTLNTTGYYRGIYFPPQGTGNATIILNEKPGELVNGEVRLYERNFSEREYAFDQVQIYGRSTAETSWRHEEYQNVTAPWEPNAYEYENQSLQREMRTQMSAWESPVIWGVAAVLVVVVLGRFF